MKSLRPADIGLALIAFILMGFVCTGEEKRPGDVVSMTPEEIYARMVASINRPGFILHTIVEQEVDAGLYSGTSKADTWSELGQDVARSEMTGEIGPDKQEYRWLELVNEDARYTRHYEQVSRGPTHRCPGTESSALFALGVCPGVFTGGFSALRMEGHSDYQGRPAIVLAWETETWGSDETFRYSTKVYLDSESLLPLAVKYDGTIDYGRQDPYRVTSRYRHEFVAVDSLPNDFFDPGSIGYVQKDPAAPLTQVDPDLTVYWLGRNFSPGQGLPDLSLESSGAASGGPGYKAILHYRLASEEFGPGVVGLQEWHLKDWEAFLAQSARHGNSWDSPCVEREEMQIAGGRATIFKSHHSNIAAFPPGPRQGQACPEGPFNDFLAHVYIGSTMIFVDMPGVYNGSFEPSPYASLEGIRAVITGLEQK